MQLSHVCVFAAILAASLASSAPVDTTGLYARGDISQSSNVDVDQKQSAVQVNKDGNKVIKAGGKAPAPAAPKEHAPAPAAQPAPAPPADSAPKKVTINKEGPSLVNADALNGNKANVGVGNSGDQNNNRRQFFGAGKQGASANGQGGSSLQGQDNAPVLSGTGNSLTSGGSQGADNSGTGGDITQGLTQKLGGGMFRRQLFGAGKQGASANGQGSNSLQGQDNAPVLSGTGNSLTSGGSQGADNSGTGGSISQQLGGGFARRQGGGLFGSQGASADAFGGSSLQGQDNAPVVSGSGNSVTAGGPQSADNSAQGGSIGQSLSQALGGRQYAAPSAYGAAGQHGSAGAFGGFSGQGQTNKPVVSGAGNSVTTGGAQQADDSAQGGQVTQGLKQIFGRGQTQGQGIGQSTTQVGSADAQGGNAYVNNGTYTWTHEPENIDTSAKAGNVVQNSSSDQDANQGATQSAQKSNQNNFWPRQIFQGQNGDASSKGGDSFDVQKNGGVLNSNGKSQTLGGPQVSDRSAIGGSISQLIPGSS